MKVTSVTPVSRATKCPEVGKYTREQMGRESGRRQKRPDSYKPKAPPKSSIAADGFVTTTFPKQQKSEPLDFYQMMIKRMYPS